MNLKNKTQLHYLINLLILLIIIVLASSIFILYSSSIFDGLVNRHSGLTFLISFICSFFSYFILTIILSNDKKNILRISIPLIICSIIISCFLTFIVYFYDNFFHKNNEILFKIWDYIYLLFASILFTILIFISQIYVTKFLMSSLSLNRAEEFTINNFVKLTFSKSNIIHGKEISILYKKNKIFILKFIQEFDQKRDLYTGIYDGEENNNEEISPDIKIVMSYVYKINKILNVNSKGLIIYLSNDKPKLIGNSINNFKIIENVLLFKEFKKSEETNIINNKKLKEINI